MRRAALTRSVVCYAFIAVPTAAFGQTATPSTVTPSTLRPEKSDNGFRVDIPETGGLKAPAGAENLQVKLDSVVVEGGFPEVAFETEAAANQLRGQTVTLARIYEVASQIEAAHARAGFVLARVVIPPQDLHDGGTLRIIVIDGFVEQVDVSAVPERVRAVVARRTAGLQGRKHLRLDDIERALLIANEVPGLTLRSTLMRGSQSGGTKLALEGRHQLISGSVGADNALAPSLGRWSVNTQFSINSPFGAGEQFYAFISSGYDISQLFSSDVRERVLGGGMAIPLGDGRLTLNPEATFTRTQPTPPPGVPETIGDLHRFTLRASYTLEKTRSRSLLLSGSIEQIEESNKAPQFALTLSRDRFMVARLGLGYNHFGFARPSYGAAVQVSQGLGGLGARTLADVLASGIGFSRLGANNNFTKLTAQGHATLPLAPRWSLAASAKAQTTFGKAVFRSEQFALEGPDGVSAYIGGSTAVDEGGSARLELRNKLISGEAALGLQLAPYILAAGGAGSVAVPTILEPKSLKSAALGVGARAAFTKVGLYLNLEYAHGFSDFAPLGDTDRVNVAATLQF